MTAEWVRFGVCAALVGLGLFCFAVGVVGVNSFDFVLNRMHASGICDTLGTLLIILGLVVANGFNFYSLKLILVLGLLWIASPVGSHLLSLIEERTSAHVEEFIKNDEEANDGDI